MHTQHGQMCTDCMDSFRSDPTERLSENMKKQICTVHLFPQMIPMDFSSTFSAVCFQAAQMKCTSSLVEIHISQFKIIPHGTHFLPNIINNLCKTAKPLSGGGGLLLCVYWSYAGRLKAREGSQAHRLFVSRQLAIIMIRVVHGRRLRTCAF